MITYIETRTITTAEHDSKSAFYADPDEGNGDEGGAYWQPPIGSFSRCHRQFTSTSDMPHISQENGMGKNTRLRT